MLAVGGTPGCVAREPGTIPLVVAAGHTETLLWIELLSKDFLPAIDRALIERGSPHHIEWTEAYGGSLAKLGGVLEAMEEGLVDMGFVASVFEAPKLPLQNVTYLAPFGSSDARLVTRVVMALHDEIPAMNQAWADNNMKLLAGAAVDNYDLYTNFPVASLDDIVGRKLLAPGPAANWIRGTGAIAVAGTLATYYNDLATGVADGALTLATGVHGSRLNEVVPYMTRVELGAHFAGGFVINLDTWNALPPLVREVFVAEGEAFTQRLADATERRRAEVLAEMQSQGLQISTLAESERRRWAHAIPNTAQEWARIHGARGLPAGRVVSAFVAHLRDAGVAVPRDWSAGEGSP